MILVADERGSLTSRELFPPGQPFRVGKDSDGRVLLEQVKAEPARARLVRSGGRTYLVGARRFGEQQVRAALEEFP